MSATDSLEERLRRALEETLAKFDLEQGGQLVGDLAQGFMDLLSEDEQVAVKAKAMEEMMAGMMSEANEVKNETMEALTDLMGGMGDLLSGLMGGGMTGRTDEESREQASKEAGTGSGPDLSRLISDMLATTEDLGRKLVQLLLPLVRIALTVLGLKRATQVSQQWVGLVERLAGELVAPDSWKQLMADLVGHIHQQMQDEN